MKIELSREMRILLITLGVALPLILISILVGDPGILGNLTILAVFIVVGPQILLRYEKYRALKEMEERFPSFLRDLIESIRSGMPFHKAIISAGQLDYGKLSTEIRKMSNQITWGMPLEKALNQFSERVKDSKRLYTTVKIVRESHLSGGDVVSMLESVADSSTILEDAEKEKKSTLNQYVILMYAISLIFVAIVVAINNLLIPIFQTTGTGAVGEVIGLTNPCNTCSDITCNICSMFEATSENLFSSDPTSIGSYYASLFFFMAIIQSIFSGLIAGQISENSIQAGFKHSLILVGLTVGAFLILIKIGLLGV